MLSEESADGLQEAVLTMRQICAEVEAYLKANGPGQRSVVPPSLGGHVNPITAAAVDAACPAGHSPSKRSSWGSHEWPVKAGSIRGPLRTRRSSHCCQDHLEKGPRCVYDGTPDFASWRS